MPFGTTHTPAVAAQGSPVTSGDGRTLAQLRAELQDITGNRSDLTSTTLDAAINDAYIGIASEVELDFLQAEFSFNTVDGASTYVLPAGVDTLQAAAVIKNGVPKPLEMKDNGWYREQRLWDKDEPHSFYRFNNALVLYPTPNGAYSINVLVVVAPQKLTTDTHKTLLGPKYDRAILTRAKAIIMANKNEHEIAAMAQNESVADVRSKLTAAGREQQGRVFGVSMPTRPSHLRRRGL